MYKNQAEQAIEQKARDIRSEAYSIMEGQTHTLMGRPIDRLQVAELILEDAEQLVAMIKAEEARKAAAPVNDKRLGRTQLSMLDALTRRSWYRGTAWVWTTVLETERILNSLVARKLVDKTERPGSRGTYIEYTINAAGRAALEASKAVAS